MKQPDNESFCVYPWFHQNIDSQGDVTLCCRSKKSLGSARDMDEIWNGEEMQEVRRKMLAGEKLEHCKICYLHESLGKTSNRQFANNEWYPERMWGPNLEESVNNGFQVTQTPSRIDLKFGNLCNLMCRMCSGSYSTQINKDIEALRKIDPTVADEFGIHAVEGNFNWYEDPGFWEIIDRYIPNLEQLDITGGEPTLVEQNMVMMQRCIDLGCAKDIKISLNTNMTNLKPAFLEMLRHFGNITINASIDGFGSVQEYIRYPSKWSVVEKNLIKVFQMSNEIRMKINVSTVCQLYNVFQMPEFVRLIWDLYEEHGNPGRLMKHQLAHVTWPTYLNITNAPKPIKKDVMQMAQDWLSEHQGHPVFGPGSVQWNCFETFVGQCDKDPIKPVGASDILRLAEWQDQNKKVSLETNIPEVYERLVRTKDQE